MKRTQTNVQGQKWEVPFVVRVPFAGEVIELTYWAADVEQADELVQRDLSEVTPTGWWVLRASGDRIIRIRPEFLAGYEIRPSGGNGRWSG